MKHNRDAIGTWGAGVGGEEEGMKSQISWSLTFQGLTGHKTMVLNQIIGKGKKREGIKGHQLISLLLLLGEQQTIEEEGREGEKEEGEKEKRKQDRLTVNQ